MPQGNSTMHPSSGSLTNTPQDEAKESPSSDSINGQMPQGDPSGKLEEDSINDQVDPSGKLEADSTTTGQMPIKVDSSEELEPDFVHRQMPRVGQGVYLAGRTGVTNEAVVRQRGITHVLNLARELADKPDSVRFPDWVSVRHVPLRDSEDQEEDLARWLPELVQHVRGAVEGGGRVVVNCWAGVSRSASVVLAYLVRHEGVSLREAYVQVRRARPTVFPNMGFWRVLLRWETAVRGWEREGEGGGGGGWEREARGRGDGSTVLLRPYVCGPVPELEDYCRHAELRIKLGWMDHLFALWTLQLLLFFLQCVGLIWL